jgi:hypothetical protein
MSWHGTGTKCGRAKLIDEISTFPLDNWISRQYRYKQTINKKCIFTSTQKVYTQQLP